MIMLFPHSSTSNHGCEAIILSITELLMENNIEASQIDLLHRDIQHDDYRTIENNCHILSFPKTQVRRLSAIWLRNQILNRFSRCGFMSNYIDFKQFMKGKQVPKGMVSIGGDNYCYGTPNALYGIDKWAKENGSKLILWGCSIENNCSADMLQDLSQFELIIARESLTYEYLKKHLETQLICLPDPAFTLKKQEDHRYDLPKNTIGINLSPMIMQYETKHNIVLYNFINLVRYILKHTDYHIALIPHVTSEKTNDQLALKMLLNHFAEDTDRITLVMEGDCRRIKYAISQCKLFIGARTHATIAAYSTLVPTLVVGYSIKARGIAKDLFGQEENYVFPVQKMKEKDDLTKAFLWLEENEAQIRQRLAVIMPGYVESACSAAKEVVRILE